MTAKGQLLRWYRRVTMTLQWEVRRAMGVGAERQHDHLDF